MATLIKDKTYWLEMSSVIVNATPKSDRSFGDTLRIVKREKTRGSKLKAIDEALDTYRGLILQGTEKAGLAFAKRPLLEALNEYIDAHKTDPNQRPAVKELLTQVASGAEENVRSADEMRRDQDRLFEWEATQPALRQTVIATLAALDIQPTGIVGAIVGATSSVVADGLDLGDLSAEWEIAGKTLESSDIQDNGAKIVSFAADFAETKYKNSNGGPSAWERFKAAVSSLTWDKFKKAVKKLIDKALAWLSKTVRESLKLTAENAKNLIEYGSKLALFVADKIFSAAIPFLENAADLTTNFIDSLVARAASIDFETIRTKTVGMCDTAAVVSGAILDNLKQIYRDAATSTAASAIKLLVEIAERVITAGASSVASTIVSTIMDSISWLVTVFRQVTQYIGFKNIQQEIRVIAKSATNMGRALVSPATANVAPTNPPVEEKSFFSSFYGKIKSFVTDVPEDIPYSPFMFTKGYMPPFNSASYQDYNFLTNKHGCYTHLIKSACNTSPIFAALLIKSGIMIKDPAHLFHGAVNIDANDLDNATGLIGQMKDQAQELLQNFKGVVKVNRFPEIELLGEDTKNEIDTALANVQAASA